MLDNSRPKVVSIPGLALQTGVGMRLLYQLANTGALPGCRRIGKGRGRFLVHLATFEEWLKTGMGDEIASKLKSQIGEDD